MQEEHKFTVPDLNTSCETNDALDPIQLLPARQGSKSQVSSAFTNPPFMRFLVSSLTLREAYVIDFPNLRIQENTRT